MLPMTPRFGNYEDRILSLPANATVSDVTSSDFLLAREGHLEVFYAPLHGITADARVVIVGLTPGKSQMVAAFREARRLLREGSRPPFLFREIGRRISFGGPMRKNLTQMLDNIGVADRLGLDTSAELFGDASHQLHSTSALRYPVLIEGSNYRGSPEDRTITVTDGNRQHQPPVRTEAITQCPDCPIGQGCGGRAGSHRIRRIAEAPQGIPASIGRQWASDPTVQGRVSEVAERRTCMASAGSRRLTLVNSQNRPPLGGQLRKRAK